MYKDLKKNEYNIFSSFLITCRNQVMCIYICKLFKKYIKNFLKESKIKLILSKTNIFNVF